MNISVGIDFGTTNSAAAIMNDGHARLVELDGARVTMPTALYFSESGKIHFGRDAIDQYTNNDIDGRFMRSLKRILGTPLMNSGGTRIGKNFIKFEQVIGYFIRHLKDKIDIAADMDVSNVVMGRPVHFRDNDVAGDARAESELRQIAIDAGFKNIAFQYEPIAAAFAHERLLTAEKLALVIDIGGGTSDFTVIRLGPGRMDCTDRSSDVLFNTGVRIGGNDFDRALSVKSFMPEFGMGSEIRGIDKILPMPNAYYFSLSTWSKVNDLYNFKTMNQVKDLLLKSLSPMHVGRLLEVLENRFGHKNLDVVENAKIQLSDFDDWQIALEFLSDKPLIKTNRYDFESAIRQNIHNIEQSIHECIAGAGIKNSDVNLIILTGGSTEIPYVNAMIKRLFPAAEFSADDKLSSVGLGLAYDSVRRF